MILTHAKYGTRRRGVLALVLAVAALGMSAPSTTVAADTTPPGTTVYVARKIVTMERANPEATAVAVASGKIIAVGSLEEVSAALGDTAFVVDETFRDRVILPGLIDQHLHPILGALTLATEVIAPEDWVLPGRTFEAADTPAEYLARLRAAHASSADPQVWLFSWGYHALWHGRLDRGILDSVSRTRPILVWQRSCHEFYLNTAAIEALGLTEAGLRDRGRARTMIDWEAGHFWEAGADAILGPVLEVLATPERLAFGLKQMVHYLHANGVTAFNEPGYLVASPAVWQLYQQVLGAPDTPFYSYFLPDARQQVERGLGPSESLADAERQVAMAPSGKVSFFPKQIKLFADGAIISQLMMMKGGYMDGHAGEWLMTPEVLEERSRLYWNAGYQLHIHVNGDAGLDTVLDVIERRMREQPRSDHRTVIVHFANSTEAQVARIARLGAIVSANPYYTVGFADRYGESGLGQPRADDMVRSGSLIRHGVPLSFHSDLPMGPSAPLYLAWSAVNRTTPSGRVAGPGQRISVDDALRAVTIEAAYSWRKERELGSIAPGKTANFTVLEQDPYAVPPIRLKEIPVWGTVFEGRLFPVQVGPVAGARSEDPLSGAADRPTVSGTVGYRERVALPATAVITVRLVDVSRADAPAIVLGEQVFEAGGRQPPFAFEIPYDPARIDPRMSYAVQARIEDGGRLRFISDRHYAVITRGAPRRVDLVLKAVARDDDM